LQSEIHLIPPHKLTPARLDEIQAFRGLVYGDRPAVVNGRNIDALDVDSWHILLTHGENIVACARYHRKEEVILGGFCAIRRGTSDALRIIAAVKGLAAGFGDTRLRANASADSGSSSILQKLGGVLVNVYYDVLYQGETHMIEFLLA
jgi:hypothetical protein